MFFRSILLSITTILLAAGMGVAKPQDQVDALRDKSWALMEQGKISEALSPNDEALKICPEADSAPVWFDRGLILQNLKRDEEALQCLNKAISIHPHCEFYLSKGNALASMHRFEEANESYTLSIKMDPTNVRPYASRAASEISLKQNEQALEDVTKAIQLDPKCYAAYVNRGTLELHKHEYAEAKADFNTALQIKPTLSVAYNQRALAFWALKDKRSALIDAETAARLDPRFRPDLEWMKKSDISESLTTESAVKGDGFIPAK